MLPPLEQLDVQQQAFITGVAFSIHSYESEDGRRFRRVQDGSYSDGASIYSSLIEMLEHLHAPITGGQLYALVATYHPLITSRVSPDRTPNQISRSEARDLILRDFTHITPADIESDGGVLRFAPIGELPVQAAAEVEPQRQRLRAFVEIKYSAHHRLDAGGIREQLERDLSRLLKADGQSLVEALEVQIGDIVMGRQTEATE